ncbi:unnamed protein product, partial [Phaeothamnion confervicola]
EGEGGGAGAASADAIFSWSAARECVLRGLAGALRVDASRLWPQGVADEAFLRLFPTLACAALSDPQACRDALRDRKPCTAALDLVVEPLRAAPALAAPVAAMLLQLVAAHDHGAKVVAGVCAHAAAAHGGGGGGDGTLAGEVLREIARTGVSGTRHGAEGARRVAEMVQALAAALPGAALANMAVLLPQLGSGAYQLRSAVAAAIGTGGGGAVEPLGDARVARLSTETREKLLDTLLDRCHDTSGYTRAAALKSFVALASRPALPKGRVLAVALRAGERLADKLATVRKAAAQLLTAVLENNPYGGRFDDRAASEARAAELRRWLVDHPPPAGPALTAEERQAVPEGLRGGCKAAGAKKTGVVTEKSTKKGGDDIRNEGGSDGEGGSESDGSASAEETEASGAEVDVGDAAAAAAAAAAIAAYDADPTGAARRKREAERAQALRRLDFEQSAQAFVDACEKAAVRAEALLKSQSASDVTEALTFFACAYRFALPCAERGLRRALSLVWREEQAVRDQLLAVFLGAFVNATAPVAPEENDGVAASLIRLVATSNTSELASLEEVVAVVVSGGHLPPAVFETLWRTATAVKAVPAPARAAALRVIAMGAVASPELVDTPARLESLLNAALGKPTLGKRDWAGVRSACLVLQRCAGPDSFLTAAAVDSAGDTDGAGRGDGAVSDDDDEEEEEAKAAVKAAEAVQRANAVEKILGRLGLFLQGRWCLPPGAEGGDESMHHWFGAAEQ